MTKPFLKWAGGKTQLLPEIRNTYPSEMNKYCEPFVGGGSVLFDVLSHFQPSEVLINDINPQLVNTYVQIKNNSDHVITMLNELQTDFWGKNNADRKIMYYNKRDEYNLSIKNNSKNWIEQAALFIFLNKTCYNGLYRINSKGEYNVPMGTYKRPPICDTDNLYSVSKSLQNVFIACGDYSVTESFIDNNTFVFIDPPYRPLSATSSFTAYSAQKFGDSEQVSLKNFTDKIASKGATFVETNSDPKNTNINDNFFDDLYKTYKIRRISAKRMINSKAANRGSIGELLISNR